jgi:alkanesulfonate monooxygenase SsuD/methylene tetrahydromethanopterin reductase-like flavin-dependent oxidoreductase (luciferase family)
MPGLKMNFDLRRPDFATSTRTELYDACIEMCKWADEQGWDALYFNEHHGAEDGYLPAPLAMCAAASTITKQIEIEAVLTTPYYNPIRLAEDLAVIDHLSHGRITPILVGGYRPPEYDMFGLHVKDRGTLVEQAVDFLRKAWTGEPFKYKGRTVQVTPTPLRPNGPPLILGARTKAGARRAAKFGDGMSARVHWDVYRAERLRLGKSDPGETPPRNAPLFLYVTDDPEKARRELGRHAMHWNNSYNKWFREAYNVQWGPVVDTVDDLAKYPDQYCFYTPEQTIELANSLNADDLLAFRPLCGGMAPEPSWACLELFAAKVLPHIDHTHPRH